MTLKSNHLGDILHQKSRRKVSITHFVKIQVPTNQQYVGFYDGLSLFPSSQNVTKKWNKKATKFKIVRQDKKPKVSFEKIKCLLQVSKNYILIS